MCGAVEREDEQRAGEQRAEAAGRAEREKIGDRGAPRRAQPGEDGCVERDGRRLPRRDAGDVDAQLGADRGVGHRRDEHGAGMQRGGRGAEPHDLAGRDGERRAAGPREHAGPAARRRERAAGRGAGSQRARRAQPAGRRDRHPACPSVSTTWRATVSSTRSS